MKQFGRIFLPFLCSIGFHSEVFMDNYKDKFLKFVDVGAILIQLKDGNVIPAPLHANLID